MSKTKSTERVLFCVKTKVEALINDTQQICLGEEDKHLKGVIAVFAASKRHDYEIGTAYPSCRAMHKHETEIDLISLQEYEKLKKYCGSRSRLVKDPSSKI